MLLDHFSHFPLQIGISRVNRVALVTGASRGFGLAMAEALAEVGAIVFPFSVTSPVAMRPTMTVAPTTSAGASRLWGLGASIDPLKFNIDKSGLRVFLAEG
jgi:NAD(P)-dependent dehydrogenase (short-subunit alcohol dehydrogenase family)